MGLMAATSMITLAPAPPVVGVAQRHFVAGLGAVKISAPRARQRSDGMKQFVDLDANDEEAQGIRPERRRFLPIHTNAFDRGFIGVMMFVAIHLFRLRFIEQSLSLYVAAALSLILAVFIVRRG
jgi:predicted small integral membrane protein